MNDPKRLIYNFEKIFLWNETQSSSLLTSLQFIPGTPEYEAFGGPDVAAADQKLPLSPGADVSMSTTCHSDSGVQCSVCGVSLGGRQEQLMHYATPYHQHNQERLLRGLQRLTLDQFNMQTHTPDDSSLSESEEEQNEDSCSESDLDEQDGNDDDDSRESPTRVSPRGGRQPRLYFLNTTTGCVVSVYRTLLLQKKAVPESGNALLKAMTELPDRLQWCYLMQSGGHFSGAVFKGNEAVVHKTFHSYTVRAGQGKSQGSYDNSGGPGHPRSAGASLRRYNEASHRQHVQEILEQWRELLSECDLIFTRVSRRNQSLLFSSGKTCLIDPRDARLRTIPFPTRKPTFTEIKRVHRLLAEVRIHGAVETFMAEMGEELLPSRDGSCGHLHDLQKRDRVRRSSKTAEEHSRSNSSSSSGGSSGASAAHDQHDVTSNVDRFLSFVEADVPDAKQKKKKAKKKKKQKFNTNQEDFLQKFQDTIEEQNMQSSVERVRDELYTCCRSGDLRRLKALVAFCQSGDVSDASGSNFSAAVVSCVERYRDNFSLLSLTMTDAGKTVLHIATEYNRHELVKWLLEEGGCDPSVQDRRHRPPYSYCTTNATKMAYRLYRASHPNAHNYAKSSIPPPVSPEEEKLKNQEKKAKRIAQKARQKENRLKKQRLLEEQRERERYLNLSDREKRALAAERRLLATLESDNSRPVLLRCFQCASDISGLVPFEYSDNQFCSTQCVRRHRDDNRTGR
ncbi:Ankyrin repeat [Trinorchestia longiramus]|nr:Ankyrin repeat [Trinorchestia longiramus]